MVITVPPRARLLAAMDGRIGQASLEEKGRAYEEIILEVDKIENEIGIFVSK